MHYRYIALRLVLWWNHIQEHIIHEKTFIQNQATWLIITDLLLSRNSQTLMTDSKFITWPYPTIIPYRKGYVHCTVKLKTSEKWKSQLVLSINRNTHSTFNFALGRAPSVLFKRSSILSNLVLFHKISSAYEWIYYKIISGQPLITKRFCSPAFVAKFTEATLRRWCKLQKHHTKIK